MSTGETLPFHLPTIIEEARAKGALIHDLQTQADVINALAGHDVYTTSEPRRPVNLKEFPQTYGREESLGLIAARATTTLARTSYYKDAARAGQLGSAVADDLRGVKTLRGGDIHMAPHPKAGKQQKGIATATSIELGVAGRETAERVAIAISGLLQTGPEGMFYSAIVGTEKEDGLVTVTLDNHDEHAARSLSRTTQALMDEELWRRFGVKLPEDKMPYGEWRRRNETFRPSVDRRLQAVYDEYFNLDVDADYRDYPGMEPHRGLKIIGTDPAPMLQALRDLMNPLIEEVREGDRIKLEQHPDPAARPLVELGVNLSRDPVKPGEIRYGPPASRPIRVSERVRQGVDQHVEEVREAPASASLKVINRVVSGLPGPVNATLKYGPKVLSFASGKGAMYREWQARNQAANEAGEKLDHLARRLRRLEEGLPMWPEE